MKMNTVKKRSGAGLILMILGIIIILAGCALTLLQRTGIFEYVLPAPSFSPDTPSSSSLEELSGILSGYEWSAAVRTQNVSAAAVSETGNRETATVYAVSEAFFDLHHETLLEGRYISGDDIRNSRKVAVISQNGAAALFPGLDPLGQVISCSGNNLEIVGITRGGFRIGETNSSVIWFPYTLANTINQSSSTLEIRVFSDSQAQSIILKNLLAQWSPDGTSYDYNRLRLTALMPLWLFGAAAGFLLIRRLVSFVITNGKQRYQSIREQLKTRYPGQMKAAFLGFLLLATASAAVCAGCIYLYLAYLMIPLYTFTDWIPEALVDPKAIIATARSLLTLASTAALYRSSDATAISLYSSWILCGSLLFTVGLCVRFLSARRKPPAE